MAEQHSLPQSTAGLIRYFDASKDAIKIKPEYVVGFSVVLVVAEVMLRLLA